MAKVTDRDDGRNSKRSSNLNPQTKHGLAIVFLFAGALILGLAFFNLAGLVGEWLKQALILGLGWVAYPVPLMLLIFGYSLLAPGKTVKLSQGAGLLLILLGVTGLTHSVLTPGTWLSAIPDGRGGGYLGYVALYPLAQVVGLWGTIILLVAVTVAGILLLFETSLSKLFAQIKSAFAFVPSFKLPERAAATETVPPTKSRESIFPAFRPRALKPNAEPTQAKPEQPPLLEVKYSKMKKTEVPLDLLEDRTGKATSGDIEANQEKIRQTLLNFGIEVEMGSVNVGPTVAQYTLAPAQGVKLASITALSNDLALALAAHPIRIEAPIPGQSLVGIEVPNQTVAMVGLKEILLSEEFKKRSSNLAVAIGKDVAGKSWVADIARMPHLLIAGSTGSGKSVCINSILISLLYANSPDELKFIIVDPKRVELASYNDVPHLLTPVITEVPKTINALKWVVGEMDRRYQVLAAAGKRNIAGYNQGMEEKMPYILVVIDELADLMAVAAAEVEIAIIRLAQMARAVGIHLIVATQRPSVDVITGLIKANITSRIAFAVASSTDSRTILDTSGAEKLLGRGDCLFISAELSKPKRLQGALVGDAEIERVTAYLKQQAKPEYNADVVQKAGRGVHGGVADDDGGDDLLEEARVVVVRAQKASASFLQRRLRVGYARAARLLDLLEERGIIGPGDGAKPRELLVRREDLDEDFAMSEPDDGSEAEVAADTAEAQEESTDNASEAIDSVEPEEHTKLES